MSSTKPKLTAPEIVDLGITLLYSGYVALSTTISGLFRGESGNRSLYWHVVHAVFRSYNFRTSPQQKHSIFPPTDQAYLAFARAKDFKPQSVSLPFGAKAHWLVGSSSDERVLVYFHGGAYVYPAAMQFEFFWKMRNDLPKGSAIILLSYSLSTTGARYPVQLQQAAGCLDYLLNTCSKKAENIIIGGDSAGGNLCAGLLSHLLHPHPEISPIDLPKPLGGAALISPWGDFSHSSEAYKRNQYKDSWNGPVLSKCAQTFLGDAKPDEYNQPFRATASWWSDLPTKVKEILITGGSEEVMVDDIQGFADKVKTKHTNTTTSIISGEVHDQAFMDPLFGVTKESESTILFKRWVVARLLSFS